MSLSYLDAIILGVVEGLTEFLPVSSTGHLTITEQLLGLPVDAKEITAYTAIIQIGAILATFLYFARKIARLFMAWVNGLRDPQARQHTDWTLAWAVIVGSIPVGLVGFLARDLISGGLRSLWVVAAALILWSVVMWVAERRHDVLEAQGIHRGEADLSVKDGLIIGLVQCFSLIPGVSRSGATISAGLLRGVDRVTATELSFFMAIPALVAAGVFQAVEERHGLANLGMGPMAAGIVVSFVVAYASIAWLLKFVATNSLRSFIWYRVGLGILVGVLLLAGVLSAT
ncbi:undecaprenyl-diphosphate phosphatase [Actinomycetota bacterium]